MSKSDRYQIGTPEMVRKQKEFDTKWNEVKNSEAFCIFFWTIIAICFAVMIGFWTIAMSEFRAEQRAQKEALVQAQAELEASCTAKSGSFLEIKSGYICLADNTVLFNVEDAMSDEARKNHRRPRTR